MLALPKHQALACEQLRVLCAACTGKSAARIRMMSEFLREPHQSHRIIDKKAKVSRSIVKNMVTGVASYQIPGLLRTMV